uniref:Lactosylceramide alpha-2,3-sialyltransferase n=1 Tax=Periophthalmus magnuspinnatus TaxID=409849 RepID=A0A3B4BAQ6_9GOBI
MEKLVNSLPQKRNVCQKTKFKSINWTNRCRSEDVSLLLQAASSGPVRMLMDTALYLSEGRESSSQVQLDKCSRCVVVGNGGILRGLELGPLINQFDTIIRLNSGPLGEFVADVGNRTSIRMAYPESTPHLWADSDPRTLFVAVIYKAVDLNWVSPLWDRLFFWQKVPAQVPIDPNSPNNAIAYYNSIYYSIFLFQNIPTLGVTAVTLASLLCDQVSLAGFGYNLSQLGWPLHYYDHLAMDAILQQKMHNINRESELLRSLVKTGTLSDLTGAIQRLYPS